MKTHEAYLIKTRGTAIVNIGTNDHGTEIATIVLFHYCHLHWVENTQVGYPAAEIISSN